MSAVTIDTFRNDDCGMVVYRPGQKEWSFHFFCDLIFKRRAYSEALQYAKQAPDEKAKVDCIEELISSVVCGLALRKEQEQPFMSELEKSAAECTTKPINKDLALNFVVDGYITIMNFGRALELALTIDNPHMRDNSLHALYNGFRGCTANTVELMLQFVDAVALIFDVNKRQELYSLIQRDAVRYFGEKGQPIVDKVSSILASQSPGQLLVGKV